LTNLYLVLADLVVVIHFLFVIFVLLGGLLVLKWRYLAWLHLPVLAWGVYIEFSHTICPLTPLEIWLRQKAGTDLYQGGFISHYLVPVIYPPGLTPDTQVIIAGILLMVNILIYGWLILNSRNRTG
jgi:hypothetical protein